MHCALFLSLMCTAGFAQPSAELQSAEWQEMGRFVEPVNCIYFLPSSGEPVTGFVGTGDFQRGHGEIFRTADSGHSWQTTDFHPSSEESVTDILFRDDLTGWATTSTSRNDAGGIYRTTDGGQSWQRTSAVSGVYLGLGYSAASTLLFAGRGGWAPIVSSDDGLTWNQILDGVVTSFGFVDDSIGFASGAHRFMPNGATFAVTTDGGRNWRSTSLNKECYQPLILPRTHEIYAIDDGTGSVYYSRDLGNTWDTVYRFASPRIWMSGCIRGNTCGRLYAQSGYSNEIGLVSSEDRGASWSDLRPPLVNAPLTSTIDTRFYERRDVVYAARYASGLDAQHVLYRYKRTNISGSVGGAPFSRERSIALVSAGCEFADTAITIDYPNDCATAVLAQACFSDTVHFQLIDETLPKRLTNVTGLRIAFIPEDARTLSTSLILEFQIGDAIFFDTVSVTGSIGSMRSLTRLSMETTLPPRRIVSGDTLRLQIRSRDDIPVSLHLDSLGFDVAYSADLFSVIGMKPEQPWRSTDFRTTADAAHITLRAPAADCPAGSLIATVLLRVMLSPDTASAVTLKDITWFGNAFTGCALARSALTHVAVERSDACGDSIIQTFMRSGTLASLEIVAVGDAVDATITSAISGTARTAIVGELGNELTVTTSSIHAGTNAVRFAKPITPGVYYLLLDLAGARLVRKFVVQ